MIKYLNYSGTSNDLSIETKEDIGLVIIIETKRGSNIILRSRRTKVVLSFCPEYKDITYGIIEIYTNGKITYD